MHEALNTCLGIDINGLRVCCVGQAPAETQRRVLREAEFLGMFALYRHFPRVFAVGDFSSVAHLLALCTPCQTHGALVVLVDQESARLCAQWQCVSPGTCLCPSQRIQDLRMRAGAPTLRVDVWPRPQTWSLLNLVSKTQTITADVQARALYLEDCGRPLREKSVPCDWRRQMVAILQV